jgi:hypothetical protein
MKRQSKVTVDLERMKDLINELDQHRNDRVKVGILAGTNARDDGTTNAEVGFKMEYGSMSKSCVTPTQARVRGRPIICWGGFPARSFLRVPLMTVLPTQIRKLGVDVFSFLLLEHGMKHALTALGQVGVDVVKSSFSTSGFGVWPQNSKKTINWKGSDRPLIDTHQLENSITYEVIGSA